MPIRPRTRAPVVAAALLLAGCAGDGPDGSGGDTWYDEIQSGIFDQSCVAAACHDSASRAGGLSLAAGESFDQLVGVLPANAVARDAGLLRVEPNSIDASFLATKIRGDVTPGEGARMPLGAGPLPDQEIAFIEAWIAAGASRTAPPPDRGGGSTIPTGSTFADLQRTIFDVRCVSSACHDDGSRAGGLSLAAATSYDEIVGVAPSTPTARDDGLVRVAPREPERSFLLNKLTGELAPGDGSRMPLVGAPLPDATIAMIRAWIAAGAPRP